MKKIFVLSLFVVLMATACTSKSGDDSAENVTLEEAKVLASEFVNDYLLPAEMGATITEAVEEDFLYKVVVKMDDSERGPGEEIDSYLSKDGKTFFPSKMDIAEIKAEKDGVADQPAAAAESPMFDVSGVVKANKPQVELFVMSHCPYGTQMEKGILPVLAALGDTIDFELKFNDYAMHAKKELDEQMSQYCLQENNPEKLQEYLACFLADETQGDVCLDTVGINKSQHNSCVATTDKKYKITEDFEDRKTWRNGQFPLFPIYEDDNAQYGITGSPGLVVNGASVDRASRDSANLLRIICAGFENEPEECQAQLSPVAPGPGFGFDSAGGSDASCG